VLAQPSASRIPACHRPDPTPRLRPQDQTEERENRRILVKKKTKHENSLSLFLLLDLLGARVVGSGIAGIVVATVGEGWCFLINAISSWP
jgi:hypothetical protein